jgi:hypothetical protein
MDDVRVYADFHRITPEVFERIKDSLPFDQVEYDGDVLRLDHEGVYLMVDDFLDTMKDLLPEGGYGHLEYIDHLDWVVTRYTITPGKIEEKRIPVDNVLDAHMRDHGL